MRCGSGILGETGSRSFIQISLRGRQAPTSPVTSLNALLECRIPMLNVSLTLLGRLILAGAKNWRSTLMRTLPQGKTP